MPIIAIDQDVDEIIRIFQKNSLIYEMLTSSFKNKHSRYSSHIRYDKHGYFYHRSCNTKSPLWYLQSCANPSESQYMYSIRKEQTFSDLFPAARRELNCN